MDLALNDHALETKAGVPVGGYDDMMRVVTEFKRANDERLAAIEARRATCCIEEKVARINAALDAQQRRLDEITLKAARPALGARTARASRARRARAQGRVRRLCALAAKARACARSK